MAQQLTWPGGQEQKTKVLADYDNHIAQDALIRGVYGKQNGVFKGCHIGCLVHDIGGYGANDIEEMGSDERHRIISEEIGQPSWLTHLAEYFFEGLEPPKNQEVSRAILNATPIGLDISAVEHKFLVWLLSDEENGSRNNADEKGKGAIDTVVALHERAANGEAVSDDEWSAARSAAESAAESAARSAAWSAAWSAAESTARSAAWSAAWSAAESAARSAAWSAAWSAQAEKLIELLREAAA